MTGWLSQLEATALAAGLAAALLLLFFWRRRTTQVLVSSLSLFTNIRPIATARRWRAWLALFLRLVAGVCIAVALIEPLTEDAQTEKQTWALLDVSPSMDTPARREAAQAWISANRWGVIAAGAHPMVLRTPGSDAEVTWSNEDVEPNWDHAVAIVEALGGKKLALTDAPVGRQEIETIIVGPAQADVAILDLTVTTGPGLPAKHLVSAQFAATTAREVTVELHSAQGIVGQAKVAVSPDPVWRVFETEPLEGEILEAVLVDADDDRAANDVLSAPIPPLLPANVWLVGPRNPFLRAAFSSLPGVGVQTYACGSAPAAGPDVALVVVDRCGPQHAHGRPQWILGATDGGPVVDTPAFVRWDRDHPTLRGVALRNLQARRAHILDLAPGETVLAGTAEGPVWVASDATRTLRWGTQLLDTDLPLSLSLPHLAYTTLVWARAGELEASPTLRAGDAWLNKGRQPVSVEGPVPSVWREVRAVPLVASGLHTLTAPSKTVVATVRAQESLATSHEGTLPSPQPPAPEPPAPGLPWLPLMAVVLLATEALVVPR